MDGGSVSIRPPEAEPTRTQRPTFFLSIALHNKRPRGNSRLTVFRLATQSHPTKNFSQDVKLKSFTLKCTTIGLNSWLQSAHSAEMRVQLFGFSTALCGTKNVLIELLKDVKLSSLKMIYISIFYPFKENHALAFCFLRFNDCSDRF